MPKVLIIEDNGVILNLVRSGLRSDPAWDLLFATDGERGLSLALQHSANLSAVLLDVFLPRLDGRQVLTRLREQGYTLPIVAISGDAQALEEMEQRGATMTIAKPFGGDLIAAALRALVVDTGASAASPERAIGDAAFDRFDGQVVPSMHALDLDIERVEHHIRVAVERRRYAGSADWEEFLLVNGAAVREGDLIRPTVAGALAFAPHPERWLLAHGVDVAEFVGEHARSTSLRFQQPIRGSIFAVIERTVDLLWARIDHATSVDARHGVAQLQHDAYPYIVLRELTVNALCHRDWRIEGAIVRIQIFSDRIEWLSPGGLPQGVAVQELRDRQLSRNPALALLLYQAGVIERFGLGLDTVFDTLQAHGHAPPELLDLGHTFCVRVFSRPGAPDTRAARQPLAAGLTMRQRKLLALIEEHEEISAPLLAEALGETKGAVLRDLNQLIAKGAVYTIGAARSTRYRRHSD